MMSCICCKTGCLQLGVGNINEANLCSQQTLQEAIEAKMATITTHSDCMHGEENKKAQLGKAYKKHYSLADQHEQHSKLYLQSKSEVTCTATKQMESSYKAVKGHKVCAVATKQLCTTRQSSLQLQSKLKKAVQGINKEVHCIKKAGQQKQELCIRRRSSQEYQSTGAEHTQERSCRGGQRRHF